jgi:hypothetical protein
MGSIPALKKKGSGGERERSWEGMRERGRKKNYSFYFFLYKCWWVVINFISIY